MGDARAALVLDLAVQVLDSFEKLEVVIAIDRAGAPQTEGQLERAAGIEHDDVVEAVAGLVASRAIAASPAGYTLDLAGPWGRHLRALVELYRVDRLEVVTAMSRAALERMRERAARAFADAFVIRKKKGDDDG